VKLNPKIFYKGKTPDAVLLSFKEYKHMLDMIEDYMTNERIKARGEEESFPAELAMDLARGKNPIKAYREYRDVSVEDLAVAAKVSAQYLQEAEAGKRIPSEKVLKAIAKALSLEADDLVY